MAAVNLFAFAIVISTTAVRMLCQMLNKLGTQNIYGRLSFSLSLSLSRCCAGVKKKKKKKKTKKKHRPNLPIPMEIAPNELVGRIGGSD